MATRKAVVRKTKIKKTGPKRKQSASRRVLSLSKKAAASKKPAAKKPAKKQIKRRLIKRIKPVVAPRRAPKTPPGRQTLAKSEKNPIIMPRGENDWEFYQTFNPAAIAEGGKIRLLYRALGKDGISRLGYAESGDGITIDDRSSEPIYTAPATSERSNRKLHAPIAYSSGGGWGGCEDPRLVKIENRVYMTFVAFDGWGSVQMAITSIDLSDFLNKRWKWKKPALVSPPGEIHKNWVLFPEKINGKYAVLHSISPNILIDYFDSLDEFDEDAYIKSRHEKVANKRQWDTWVRGAGPPPIKTKYGWLLFYHAIDASDPGRYKLGAMILDSKDPTKILYRAQKPVLEPDEIYENEGHKAGIIYSCGAVVTNGQLLVYYGGADTVVCVATADLDSFLHAMTTHRYPTLTKIKRRPRK